MGWTPIGQLVVDGFIDLVGALFDLTDNAILKKIISLEDKKGVSLLHALMWYLYIRSFPCDQIGFIESRFSWLLQFLDYAFFGENSVSPSPRVDLIRSTQLESMSFVSDQFHLGKWRQNLGFALILRHRQRSLVVSLRYSPHLHACLCCYSHPTLSLLASLFSCL